MRGISRRDAAAAIAFGAAFLCAVSTASARAPAEGLIFAQNQQAAPSTGAKPSTGATSPKQEMVNINTATADQLDALPGIGQARAKAIIANRPYKSKEELLAKKVVPQNVYNDIKDRIAIR